MLYPNVLRRSVKINGIFDTINFIKTHVFIQFNFACFIQLIFLN